MVLGLWVLAFVAIGAASSMAGGKTNDNLRLPGTESQQAIDLLNARGFSEQAGSSTQVVFQAPPGHPLSHSNGAINATLAAMAKVPGVSATVPPIPGVSVSEDRTIGIGMVMYPTTAFDVDESTLQGVADAAEIGRAKGLDVEFGGEVIPGVSMEPPSSELIGLGVAVIVLLFAFGSVLAMGLPILTALIGLGIGLSGVGLLSAVVELSSSAPTLAIMIGLAVGIDYALFIVTRHRQNLALGMAVDEAAARANATAGGAVVFAGMTVVIAIAALSVVRIPFLTIMGLAAAATVAIAVMVAVSLLPAMLGFVGNNIDRFKVPGLKNRTGSHEEGETLGIRWATLVTRRPVLWLAVGLGIMAVLALPAASIHLGLPDNGSEPARTTQRKAYDLVTKGFGPGENGALMVVVDLKGVSDTAGALKTMTSSLELVDDVRRVGQPTLNPANDTAVVTVVPKSGPASAETEALVHELRGDLRDTLAKQTGATYFVAGATAANIDISAKLAGTTVPFIALVIGLTIVLLTMVFRSIIVPIKAAIAILVSIGSSFGVVVAVFNWGWFGGLVGLENPIPIVSFLPLMMFAILFGLSMDYEVFILSRIHEEYHRSGDATRSVLVGLSASARVITAAAIIMISVFGAFAFGDSPFIKMFGLGLAIAVFLDATVVRMVIVPAVMTLFGEKAWKLPPWLDRILPNLDVEGSQLIDHLEEVDRQRARQSARTEPEPVTVG